MSRENWDVFEHIPTVAINHPQVAPTRSDYEKVVMSNQRLYELTQQQEKEISELRKSRLRWKAVANELETARATAHRKGVLQALKRASQEVWREFGVSSLNLNQLIEDLDR